MVVFENYDPENLIQMGFMLLIVLGIISFLFSWIHIKY